MLSRSQGRVLFPFMQGVKNWHTTQDLLEEVGKFNSFMHMNLALSPVVSTESNHVHVLLENCAIDKRVQITRHKGPKRWQLCNTGSLSGESLRYSVERSLLPALRCSSKMLVDISLAAQCYMT